MHRSLRCVLPNALALLLLFVPGLERQPRSVSLALVGDVMLGRGVAQVYSDSGNWEDALLGISRHLQGADLALANLESPLSMEADESASGEPNGGYNLCAPSVASEALVAAGLDLLSLANNHTDDCSAGGARETNRILEDSGMEAILPGPEPVWRDINGVRLAFLALDDVSNEMNIAAASRTVRDARSQGAVVVVSVHWGNEYEPVPTNHQRELAQAMADAGASLIWGHHPHVLQPVEWVQGEGQETPALVAYSLGNALFDQHFPETLRRSMLLSVRLNAVGVLEAWTIPYQVDARNGRVLPPQDGMSAVIR